MNVIITETLSGAAVGTMTTDVDRLPALIPVSAAGLVTRSAWISSASPTVDLISETGFDLAFYRQMARNNFDAPGSLEPLRVLPAAPAIYLQTEGLSDANVAALEQAARTVFPALTGNRFQLTTWETGRENRERRSGWITVELFHDPSDSALCGSAGVGAVIGRMRLNTASRCGIPEYVIDPGVFAHEIGHALGFWHVEVPGHLMKPNVRRAVAVSDKERHHAAIAYSRRAGNTDIDVDASTGTGLSLSPLMVVD